MSRADLPPFAKEWMRQWASAGPALERVRAAELRALDADDLTRATSVHDQVDRVAEAAEAATEGQHPRCGLIDQQAWFMRLRVVELERRLRALEGK